MSKVLDLMKKTHLCVFSTLSSDGKPQSAVVGFAENDRYAVVIGTSRKSRKYRNILNDPRVSLVVGWDDKKTVQYEGLAHEAKGEERTVFQRLHFAKHPEAEKYKDDPDEAYIVIKPMWIRYTDCNKYPWDIEEIKAFA